MSGRKWNARGSRKKFVPYPTMDGVQSADADIPIGTIRWGDGWKYACEAGWHRYHNDRSDAVLCAKAMTEQQG